MTKKPIQRQLSDKRPTISEWKALYNAMREFKKLMPWEILSDEEEWAIQDPETGKYGYVTVMGALGEHYAVTAYLEAEGLSGLYDLMEAVDEDRAADIILETPMLQASLEDRDLLDKQDHKITRKLNMSFRGKNAWPWFRCYRPGFVPWHLEAWEVRFLSIAIEQVNLLTKRLKENPDLLTHIDVNHMFLRKPVLKDNAVQWEDAIIEYPDNAEEKIHYNIHLDSLKALQKLPVSQTVLEIDLIRTFSPIAEKNKRPYYGYLMLLVDENSGMILGQELMVPLPDLNTMRSHTPQLVLDLLLKINLKPDSILMCPGVFSDLTEPVFKEVGIPVVLRRFLAGIDEFRAGLKAFEMRDPSNGSFSG